MHITLLGDSVFDNAAYTGGEPTDFAHTIEPSGIGGSKIAAAIASVVGMK